MPRYAQRAGYAYLHICVIFAIAYVARANHEINHGEFYPSLYQRPHVNIRTTESTSKIYIYLAWSHRLYSINKKPRAQVLPTLPERPRPRNINFLNYGKQKHLLHITTRQNNGNLFAVISSASQTLRPLLIGRHRGISRRNKIRNRHLHRLALSSSLAGSSILASVTLFALFLAMIEILSVLVHSRLRQWQLLLVHVESDRALGC